jgi:hypothetical protein
MVTEAIWRVIGLVQARGEDTARWAVPLSPADRADRADRTDRTDRADRTDGTDRTVRAVTTVATVATVKEGLAAVSASRLRLSAYTTCFESLA